MVRVAADAVEPSDKDVIVAYQLASEPVIRRNSKGKMKRSCAASTGQRWVVLCDANPTWHIPFERMLFLIAEGKIDMGS